MLFHLGDFLTAHDLLDRQLVIPPTGWHQKHPQWMKNFGNPQEPQTTPTNAHHHLAVEDNHSTAAISHRDSLPAPAFAQIDYPKPKYGSHGTPRQRHNDQPLYPAKWHYSLSEAEKLRSKTWQF